jgi:hypothetical protein
VICGGIAKTDAAKPWPRLIAHLEENAATRGIVLSIADMDAPERLTEKSAG